MGARTGIDLPGESAGHLGTPETVEADGGTWYGGSTVILGIGQGDLQVTPLQNARWTAAVSTGKLVTPRLGLAIGHRDGRVHRATRAGREPVPFAAELGPVRDGMRAAVTGGTATRLAGLPVPAGAKTGTAQDGGLRDGEYDNWMSAVAPDGRPRDRDDRTGAGAGDRGEQRDGRGGRRPALLPRAPAGHPGTGLLQAP